MFRIKIFQGILHLDYKWTENYHYEKKVLAIPPISTKMNTHLSIQITAHKKTTTYGVENEDPGPRQAW